MITAMTETLPGLDLAGNLTVWGPFRQQTGRRIAAADLFKAAIRSSNIGEMSAPLISRTSILLDIRVAQTLRSEVT